MPLPQLVYGRFDGHVIKVVFGNTGRVIDLNSSMAELERLTAQGTVMLSQTMELTFTIGGNQTPSTQSLMIAGAPSNSPSMASNPKTAFTR